MTDPEAMGAVATRIEPAHFTHRLPGKVYESAYRLHSEGHLSGVQVVIHDLDDRGVLEKIGGEQKVRGLVTFGWQESEDDLSYYIQRLETAYALRRQGRAIDQALAVIEDGESLFEDKQEAAREALDKLLKWQTGQSRTVYTAQELLDSVIEHYHEAKEGVRRQVCPTGFMSLDGRIGGFPKSRVSIVAARTSHGKTAWTTQVALQVARRLKKEGEGQVVYFSCEMGPDEMERRLAAPLARINPKRVRDGDLRSEEEDRLYEAHDRFHELPITIDTFAAPSTDYLMSRLAALSLREPVKLAIFDYLDYTGEKGDRQQALDRALIGCHRAAKRFNVPFVALHQLNRNMDHRSKDNPKPRLTDLSWSSDVEKKAKLVVMLYHPWTHWRQTEEVYDEPDKEKFEVLVQKNTEGGLGGLKMRFIPEEVRFVDPQNESRKLPHDKAPF